MSLSVLSMFSSKGFIVSGLTFRSLIHFEFVFVYGVRSVLISFFYMQLSSFPSTIYLKGCLCLIVYSCLLCQNKVPIGTGVYLWVLYLVPLVYISVFVPLPCYLDDCSFVVQSEVRKVDSSSSILLSQDCFGYSGSLCFYVNCEIFYSSSVKNVTGNLIGIALNLQIAFGSIVIFTILIFPTQENEISLHLFMSSLISFISVLQFSVYSSFVSLDRFIPWYFIVFVAMVNGIDYLISLSSVQ